jgi:hypothetical protein
VTGASSFCLARARETLDAPTPNLAAAFGSSPPASGPDHRRLWATWEIDTHPGRAPLELSPTHGAGQERLLNARGASLRAAEGESNPRPSAWASRTCGSGYSLIFPANAPVLRYGCRPAIPRLSPGVHGVLGTPMGTQPPVVESSSLPADSPANPGVPGRGCHSGIPKLATRVHGSLGTQWAPGRLRTRAQPEPACRGPESRLQQRMGSS